MTTFSLCMIVKNEEKVLARCLESTKDIFDEIIIVDTGSTDKTKEIALKYTDKVFDFKWCDDFAKARNFSFSKATKEYIMWLDGDDVILKEDRKKLISLKESLDKNTDIFMLRYNTGFDENGNVTFSYYRERIIKNFKNYTWVSPIHEVIPLTGKIAYEDISITHKKDYSSITSYSKRNLKIFEKMINDGITLDARQKFYYARELYYNEKYAEAITKFNEFLNDPLGWIENKVNACLDLSNIYLIQNDKENAIFSLVRSFYFCIPRAEICCAIAKIFQNDLKFNEAIFWYKLATTLTPDLSTGAFYNLDAYNFIPYIELSVCYYKINDIKESKKYNEMAGKTKPYSKLYLNNKKFFESLEK